MIDLVETGRGRPLTVRENARPLSVKEEAIKPVPEDSVYLT